MLVMAVAIFLTASRAGFIDLIFHARSRSTISPSKGRRPMLIMATVSSRGRGDLRCRRASFMRFAALSGNSTTDMSAYGSYEDRKYLMVRAVEGIEHYPVFGLGARNFKATSPASGMKFT